MFKIYGAGGLGVDIEPELIAIANKSAEENHLEHLVTFRSAYVRPLRGIYF